ncbi:MAG: hypothetical protein ACR2MX_10985 [Cyclobacteriaceae bacterium]
MPYAWLNLVKADGATILIERADDGSAKDSIGSNDFTYSSPVFPGVSLMGNAILPSMKLPATEQASATHTTDFDLVNPTTIEFFWQTGDVFSEGWFIFGSGPVFATNGLTFVVATIILQGVLSSTMTINSHEASTNWATATDGNQSPAYLPQHVVCVFNATGDGWTVYWNGVVAVEQFDSGNSGSNIANPVIGAAGNSTEMNFGPFVIYKGVELTAIQARNHYNAAFGLTDRSRDAARDYRR